MEKRKPNEIYELLPLSPRLTLDMFQLTDLPEGEKNLILEQLDSREREREGLEEKLELQDYQEAVDSAEVSRIFCKDSGLSL